MHKRFEEKYPNICIPPLPEKPLTGSYDENFLNLFELKLDLWLNKVSSHPVLRESELLFHFLRTQNQNEWKRSKRRGEQDLFSGSQWFCTVKCPASLPEPTFSTSERIRKFSKAVITLDNQIKLVNLSFDKMILYHNHYYKKELFVMGKRIEDLASILAAEHFQVPATYDVCRGVKNLGQIYIGIGNSYAKQSKDVQILKDQVDFLRQVAQQMIAITEFEKNASVSYKCIQQKSKAKGVTMQEVTPRRDKISHVTLAEINHFNKDNIDDIGIFFKKYVDKQVLFYSSLLDSFKECQQIFQGIDINKRSHF